MYMNSFFSTTFETIRLTIFFSPAAIQKEKMNLPMGAEPKNTFFVYRYETH